MNKVKFTMMALAASLLIVFIGVACTQAPAPSPSPSPTGITLEQSRDIARDFVTREPTYVFDGMPETLQLIDTVTLATDSWQFTYQFDSRQGGYGDRTGQVLTQVITPHKAIVTVAQGKVTKAIMDSKWDMLKQQLITA